MRSGTQPILVFAVILIAIFLLHLPLLQLPYFWDEAGYYVPAARDFLQTGSLIPHSTPSNAHPPLVMMWLALWWKCVGYAPLVTRSAMLLVAAFSLTGFFRLAELVANTEVAIAATACTAVYPVFFSQSSMAHVDLAAAGLTFWALCAYLQDRRMSAAIWFSLAGLAKETAILAPMALAVWEIVLHILREHGKAPVISLRPQRETMRDSTLGRVLSLLLPAAPLALWYGYHYARTGYVFGNPEFFRYNVAATMSPLRFLLAFATRVWQASGYLHLWVLAVMMLLAMFLHPLKDDGVERQRIAIPVQIVFLVLISTYVIALSAVGGALLARYMLTAVPLVILVAVSTLRRRLRHWPSAIAVVGGAFILGWFWNPPYGFSPEDNLAYRDFIVLHQNAERYLEARYPMARVLTAWPASGELRNVSLGYVTRPMRVVQIEDFSADEVLSAAEWRSNFDVALVFSTKYEPAHPLLDRWQTWADLKSRFFGFHRDLPPGAIAQILGGHIVFSEPRPGLWAAVIELEKGDIRNAKLQHGTVTEIVSR